MKQWEETGQGPGLFLSFPFISNGISFPGVFIPHADSITKAVFPASRCCGEPPPAADHAQGALINSTAS